jgi:hypothetical protein
MEQPPKKLGMMEDIEKTTERVREYPSFLRTASSAARVERDRRLQAAQALAETPLEIYDTSSKDGAEIFRHAHNRGSK